MKKEKHAEGTVESHPWPEHLPAHITSAEGSPRVQGYDLHRDLAMHYDFAEYIVTALTGAPPNREWGRAVNMALVALAGASIRDASVHAATLARRCGANDRSTLATGMLTLAEEAANLVAEDGGRTPEQSDEVFVHFCEQLPEQVRASLDLTVGSIRSLSLEILHAVGLEQPLHQITAVCMARLPTLAAEALAVKRGDVRTYPMQLPRFEYTDHRTDDT